MDAVLKLYESTGVTEYGTLGNPIVFSSVVAGTVVNHPLNPFYLWNDKGGILGSVPARQIEIQLLNMWIQSENVGTSNGTGGQTFNTILFPIVDNNDPEEIIVYVGTAAWTRVGSFSGQATDAEVYTINTTTGLITFGNGVNGKIPPNGLVIYVTYMPELLTYGDEIYDNVWLEVKSLGATTNVVAAVDEQHLSSDTTHVYVANTVVTSVGGVWLATDPGHSGTNYYTGGSYDANSGLLTLGSALPGTNTNVLVNYTYLMTDDFESAYTPIGFDATHTFTNHIPSNNAKLLYFRLNVPADASTGGGSNLNFRLRLKYRQV